MKKPVRWGILGASKFAREQMAPAIHMAENAQLVALATSSSQKAEPFRALVPGLRLFDSYDDLLTDPEIDAIYLPLPNHLHVEWVLKAVDAGKHVLCEKPIAMRAAEIDALILARDRSGCFVSEAYMIVHHPQWQRAKSIYESGAIGDLTHVEGVFCYNNQSDGSNIRNRSETGGGGIPDIGVYTYGATRWLTGQEPLEITHADVDFENGVDVRARVSARFNGFTAHWVNSMRMHPYQEMVFLGTDGILKMTAPFNPSVYGQAEIVVMSGMTTTVERFTRPNHYLLQVEAFGAHIRDGKHYPWSLEDARGTQAVIDAVFAKATQA